MTGERPQSNDGFQEGYPFSEAMTSLSPDFVKSFYEADPSSVVSNDRELRKSYSYGVDHRTFAESTSEKTQVVAIVGNGSFETAAQMFPDCPVLFCDKDPVTLFAQRVILENLRNQTTPEGFLTAMEDFTEAFQPYVKERMFDIRRSYEDQKRDWQAISTQTETPDHFLSSQVAYDAARDSLMEREVAFWQLDLRNIDEIRRLNQALDANNAEILLANVTNLYEGFTGAEIRKNLRLAYLGTFMGAEGTVNTSRTEVVWRPNKN